MVREEYHNNAAKIFSNSKELASLKEGDIVSVSQETLDGFIENAYIKINSANRKNRWITDSFTKCGLDPWSDNTKKEFDAHLEKLLKSRV